MDFIRKHLWQGQVIEGVRRRETLTIPPVALREVLINAVVHADYAQTGAPFRISLFENRLEIENPGLLPLGMTVEDLPQGVSKLRNRIIARVFKEIGLVEHWGSGIQRMRAACLDAGLPEPCFEEVGMRFPCDLRVQAYADVPCGCCHERYPQGFAKRKRVIDTGVGRCHRVLFAGHAPALDKIGEPGPGAENRHQSAGPYPAILPGLEIAPLSTPSSGGNRQGWTPWRPAPTSGTS